LRVDYLVSPQSDLIEETLFIHQSIKLLMPLTNIICARQLQSGAVIVRRQN